MIADIGLTFAGSPCWVASGFELHGSAFSDARNILKADLSVKKQKEIYPKHYVHRLGTMPYVRVLHSFGSRKRRSSAQSKGPVTAHSRDVPECR